jgi:fructosamine-3-kinase
LSGVKEPLKILLKPIQLPFQVIHGDMAGNILFPAQGDPIVIDFSPYWRPAEFATAILIVDAVVWEGAPDSILSEMNGVTEGKQLLVRAAMWRIKTTEEYLKQYGKGDLGDVDAYQHLIDLLN